jgi:hypothetical protein
VRGGVILPMHSPGALTTTDARSRPMFLLTPLDKDGKAAGEGGGSWLTMRRLCDVKDPYFSSPSDCTAW